MSVDSDKGKRHLTPEGWIRADKPSEYPENRVETWDYSMNQASGWSKENIYLSCEWVSEDWSREARDGLRKKFPFPEEELPHRHYTVSIGQPL